MPNRGLNHSKLVEITYFFALFCTPADKPKKIDQAALIPSASPGLKKIQTAKAGGITTA